MLNYIDSGFISQNTKTWTIFHSRDFSQKLKQNLLDFPGTASQKWPLETHSGNTFASGAYCPWTIYLVNTTIFLNVKIALLSGMRIELLLEQPSVYTLLASLVFNQRSIDLSGAQEKEGHFHYISFHIKTFWELRNEVSHAIPAPSSQNPFTLRIGIKSNPQ